MIVPNGQIAFLSNVPITNSYEHTIDFKDANEQIAYWRPFVKIELNNYTYIRREREYLAVSCNIAELDNVNYMYFRARDNERLYYAFVIDKTYVNEGVTNVYFQIDVLQTFMFDYSFRESYIQQAHVDRWENAGKPRYSLTDEGLDYGTDYKVESAYKIEQEPGIRWLLVTTVDFSSIDESGGLQFDKTKSDPVPSTFKSFLVPFVTRNSNNVTNVICTITGAHTSADVIVDTYTGLIDQMLKNKLGEFIKSIAVLPYNPFVDETIKNGETYKVIFSPNVKINTVTLPKVSDGLTGAMIAITYAPAEFFSGRLATGEWSLGLENTLPSTDEWAEVKSKPLTTKRNKKYESKLLCYPYRYNLLADWRNDTVVYKNEFLDGDTITIKYVTALTYNAPFRFYIDDYKDDKLGRNNALTQPLAPEMPIISDEYSTYMLQNKNTIQANLTNSYINAATGVVKGAINGAGAGGAYGAIFGAVGGAVNGALDVSAQIRSQNALQQDLKAKPDHIINSVDSAFNVTDGTDIVSFYRMAITPEAEAILSDYFNMYGYIVKRVEVPNLKSRKRFNYLKTVSASIVGSISQRWLTELKAIYDKGVTVWHYSEEDFNFLDYSFENIEVKLL